MKTQSRGIGFTLPEILVTVTIIAVLAAVVVPAVVQQISRGDVGELSSDMKSLQTAVSTFATDVQAFPSHLHQIRTGLTTADSAIESNGAGSMKRPFSAVEAARWRGPYGGTSIDSLISGFGLVIGGTSGVGDSIRVVNHELAITAHGPTLSASGASYSGRQITHIDSLVDAGTGANAGLLRWTTVGAAPNDSARNIKVVVGTVH